MIWLQELTMIQLVLYNTWCLVCCWSCKIHGVWYPYETSMAYKNVSG